MLYILAQYRIVVSNMKFEIEGENMVKKTVRRGGNSGHIYVPKAWMGKEVVVVLVE